MPDELRQQVDLVHEIIQAMGLPVLVVEGVEADDVIGTLAVQAAGQGMEVLISTGDKDMAQLVNDHVTLVNTMTDTVMDREGVVERFGIPPERIIDYLALVGDTSDNIPGVPNVGPKTAVKWLNQYGSLDEIKEHAEDLKGKVGENLKNHRSVLPLSRRLATIKCDVKLDRKPRELERLQPDEDRLRALYSKLEFKSWLSELGGLKPETGGLEAAPEYEIIQDERSLDQWIKQLRSAGTFSFDTETTSLDTLEAELVGVSFSDRVGAAAYVPCGHDYPGVGKQIDRSTLLKKLKPLLEDKSFTKIMHNLKFDMGVLENYGVRIAGHCRDTMLESYVLDSTATRHDMDTLALKYLGLKTVKYEDVTGRGKSQINFREVPIEEAGPYAAEDADVTIRLDDKLRPRLAEVPALTELFEKIEMPLVPVLSRMERNGVNIDSGLLEKQSSQLDDRIREIEKEAWRAAGGEFNLASPKQIQEVLFDRLELPVISKTPKGQPSTSEEVLQELAATYPLPQMILEHRGLSKLKSTYSDKLPRMINPLTGRVHTSYHQAVAATGRLSSSDPNLQNIPVRTPEGRKIRQAFVAGPGMKIVSADYSQIELRIMAHLSGDKGLLKAFQAGEDVHRATAAELFGISPLEVQDDQRRPAKVINFGLIYGMSAFGLARQLKTDRNTAQEYIDRYFDRYPGVRAYMEDTRKLAHDQGYVETLFGRRLYLPEIRSRNHARRQYAQRTAINAPMQGTAADLIKMAMIAVDEWIQKAGKGIKMIMQVHDELVFEVPESLARETRDRVRRAMTSVAKLSVPLVVDIGVGDNWDEAH